MDISLKHKRLLDAYRFTNFRPLEKIRGIFGDSKARVITLVCSGLIYTDTSIGAIFT